MTQPIPDSDPASIDIDMVHDCALCRDHLEEFALGILNPHAATQVEEHIYACAACRTEYEDIYRVTWMLPFLAEPVDPSPHVKDALFARIARAEHEDSNPVVVLDNPWASIDQPDAVAASTSKASIWQRWVMPGVIAPLAICLIVLAAWANSLGNNTDDVRPPADENIAAIGVPTDASRGLQLYAFKPACENCTQNHASGQLGGNPSGNVGVVVAWNLDPNEQHQVWCVDDEGKKLLITDLDVEYTGNVSQTVNFPEALGGYQQIYVARHDGTADPDAELMVAINDQHQIDAPGSTPAGSTEG